MKSLTVTEEKTLIPSSGNLSVFADESMEGKSVWWVYMILADDQSIYTGITTDVERRFHQHCSGQGARYFRGRRPLKVIYTEMAFNRSAASRREAAIKKLNRPQKLAMIASNPSED